jgi:hypothetical protein
MCIIADSNYAPMKLPTVISWPSPELLPRKGLQRKAHRICIGKSEDFERKARFFARLWAKNAPKKYKPAVSKWAGY